MNKQMKDNQVLQKIQLKKQRTMKRKMNHLRHKIMKKKKKNKNKKPKRNLKLIKLNIHLILIMVLILILHGGDFILIGKDALKIPKLINFSGMKVLNKSQLNQNGKNILMKHNTYHNQQEKKCIILIFHGKFLKRQMSTLFQQEYQREDYKQFFLRQEYIVITKHLMRH